MTMAFVKERGCTRIKSADRREVRVPAPRQETQPYCPSSGEEPDETVVASVARSPDVYGAFNIAG